MTTYAQTWGFNERVKMNNQWPTLNQMQLHEPRGKFNKQGIEFRGTSFMY